MQGRYRNGIPEAERQRLIGCSLSGAIIAAPFLALLVSQTLGLLVLALALATAAWFAYEASADAVDRTRINLRLLSAINVVFLVMTIAALIWLRID